MKTLTVNEKTVPVSESSSLINDFLSGKSDQTVRAYRRDLENFSQWTGESNSKKAVRKLLNSDQGRANQIAVEYKNHLIEKGLSPSTVNRRLSALRSLVDLAKTFGLVNWTLSVENVKSEAYRDTRGPGRKGFEAMLGAARERNDNKGIRDIAIMRLLHDRGLRRSEAVSLDLEHIDLENATVAVLGKGKKERKKLSIPKQTVEALEDWIEVRGNEPGPLFTNFDHAQKGSGRLRAASIYDTMKRYGEKAGVKNWHPHGLRHLAITEGLERTNGNVRAVKDFSRHADVKTLMLYDDNRKDQGGEVAQLVAAGV